MTVKKKIYKLPTYLAPREKNNKHKYKYIPKKIFQTGESHEVTKGMYDAVHTWIDKNPDWEYHFFDKTARRDFIKEHFPKKVLDAYDNLIPGAYKADLWRYCVLYIYGGLYVDNKCELLASSLNDVIPEDVEFLSLDEGEPGSHNDDFGLRIMQCFLCAKEDHEFLEKAIDLVVENVRTGYYGYTPVCPTGPSALGKAIKLVLKVKKNDPNYLGKNFISGFNFILWPKKYLHKHPKYSGWLIGYDKNADPIIQLECFDYRSNQASISKSIYDSSYRVCWLFDRVYKHGKVYRPYYNSFFKRLYVMDVLCAMDFFFYKGRSKLKLMEVVFTFIRKRPFYSFYIYFKISKKLLKYFILRPSYKLLRKMFNVI